MSNASTPPPPLVEDSLTEQLRQLRQTLQEGVIERDLALRLGLLGLLTGEHLLLIGPAGAAKRLVGQRIASAMEDAHVAELLMTEATSPSELHAAAPHPEATVALLLEPFRAQGATLQTLSQLLEERLLTAVGTCRSAAPQEGLEVLQDGFLLWLHVASVSPEGFRALLQLPRRRPPHLPDYLRFTVASLGYLRARCEQIALPEDILELLTDLRGWCAQRHLDVSDKRWLKSARLMKMSALTHGRDTVSTLDCWLLPYTLARTPELQRDLCAWCAARLSHGPAREPTRLYTLIASWEERLQAALNSRAQIRDAAGQPLFRNLQGGLTTERRGPVQAMRNGEPLYLLPHNFVGQRVGNLPPVFDRTQGGRGYTEAELEALFVKELTNFPVVSFSRWSGKAQYLASQDNWLLEEGYLPPVMEPARHKPATIAKHLAALRELNSQVELYRDGLKRERRRFEHELVHHLWILPRLIPSALDTYRERLEQLESLHTRVSLLIQRFEALPLE